jgi:polyhydroxyalkanoate synthesis regulator phasin
MGLKDIMLAGLGALALSQDKVQEILKDLVKRGEMTTEQAQATLAAFAERGAKERDALGTRAGDLVSKVVAAMDYARRSDVEKLEARVRALEEKSAG